MKKQFIFTLLAAVFAVPGFALTCEPGTFKVVLNRDTVGTVNSDVFQQIDFKSPTSLESAIANGTAYHVRAGTFACRIAGDGFQIYAAHLAIPGYESALWVPDDGLTAAD